MEAAGEAGKQWSESMIPFLPKRAVGINSPEGAYGTVQSAPTGSPGAACGFRFEAGHDSNKNPSVFRL